MHQELQLKKKLPQLDPREGVVLAPPEIDQGCGYACFSAHTLYMEIVMEEASAYSARLKYTSV